MKLFVVPRHSVFLRFIDVPSLNLSEIRKMVEFQAVKDIPYPKEEMVVSHRIIGSYKDGFSSVMLAVANKDFIKDFISKSGSVDFIRLHTELMYLYLLKNSILEKGKVNFVIHIGAEDSEMMIIDSERLIFSRGFRNSEKFLEEIDNSILAFEKNRNNPAVDNIIIINPSYVDIKDAESYLRGHFTLPVKFCEYSEDLSALDLDAKIDFVPEETNDKRQGLQRKKEYMFTCALLVLAVFLLLGSLFFKTHEKRKILNELSSSLSAVQPDLENLDSLLRKTQLVNNRIEQGKFIARILKNSHELAVRGIDISGIEYDGKKDILYKGTSSSMDFISNFVKALEGPGYFSSVEVKYAAKKMVKDAEVIVFDINSKLKLD